jgi:hypothetical protein
MRAAPWLAFLVVPAAACVSTNAALLDPSVKYQKICPGGVQLFTTADHVASDYREIALLHSKGESGWTTERGMMSSQRQKAAALGANGIVLNSIKEPNAGTKIIGAILGTGSERQGAAVAIYIPADSDRVKQACGLAPKESQIASSRALIHSSGSASPPMPAMPATVALSASERAPAQPAALADAPAPSGYASYPTDSPQPVVQRAPVAVVPPQPSLQAESVGDAGRFNGELRQSVTFRRAMDDGVRLRLVADFQELRMGILRLNLGEGFATSTSVDYNLNRLRLAYSETISIRGPCLLELWYRGQKVGEYTESGLLLGPEYSAPR